MTAQIGNLVGFVDARESTAAAAGDNQDSISNVQNYQDDISLDSRLTTLNPTYYTVARLAQMTLNDKQYALRYSDDLASFGLGSDL